MLLQGTLALVLVSARGRSARGQEANLEECLDAGTFCSESDAILMDESCGQKFYRFRGRIAWPPLRNLGPVTISIRTRALEFRTAYPLYLEVVAPQHDPGGCLTYLSAWVILVGQGADQCGGAWETFGPIDLREFGVPLGSTYHLQAAFFEQLEPAHLYSVGLSCIRVTSQPDTTSVTSASWTLVKSLYR